LETIPQAVGELEQRIIIFAKAFQDLIKEVKSVEVQRIIQQQEINNLKNEIDKIKRELKKESKKKIKSA